MRWDDDNQDADRRPTTADASAAAQSAMPSPWLGEQGTANVWQPALDRPTTQAPGTTSYGDWFKAKDAEAEKRGASTDWLENYMESEDYRKLAPASPRSSGDPWKDLERAGIVTMPQGRVQQGANVWNASGNPEVDFARAQEQAALGQALVAQQQAQKQGNTWDRFLAKLRSGNQQQQTAQQDQDNSASALGGLLGKLIASRRGG